MFNSIWLLFFIIGITILFIFIQREFKERKKERYCIILPIICFIFSVYKSIPSFEKAFYIQFSLGAFLASILFFVVLNIPTIVLFIATKKEYVL